MPPHKAPEPAEMTRFVLAAVQRFGSEVQVPETRAKRGPVYQELKSLYLGWAAVEWVETNGQLVTEDVIDNYRKGVRVRAGNSLEKRLWRDRILFVAPLQAHYRLPRKTWQWVLQRGVAGGHFPPVAAPEMGVISTASLSPFVIVLANEGSVMIDRATRGPQAWNHSTFQYREGVEAGLVLDYIDETAGPETLRQQLMSLDPRTSDVWRLLTAKALENEDANLFKPITIKPGELAKALGLKVHPNGSVRSKDILRCTQSLVHLERLWLSVNDAGPEHDQGTRQRVMAVMARGRSKKVQGESVPSFWTIVLGEWANYFPRSFAPIFRGLVELSGNAATNVWAKQIGTELSYWLRETADNPATIRLIQVKTLLVRASLIQETREFHERKNLNRAIERFEATLNLLGELGLHECWSYEPQSSAAMDSAQGRPEFLETWLGSWVELQIPEPFLRSIAQQSAADQIQSLSVPNHQENHLTARLP